MIELIVWLGSIAIAITIHEFAHAWVADRLGDPTARLDGRLSLNPARHYDPVGTTLLVFTSILRVFGTPVIPFGWAKPVPFDPYNLKDPKRDTLLIALAGPVSNFILAIGLALLLRAGLMEFALLRVLSVGLITLNVSLAIFNLIPVYPLDGGKILYGLLPHSIAEDFRDFMQRYGVFVLVFLIMPFGGRSLLSSFISPLISFFLNLLLG